MKTSQPLYLINCQQELLVGFHSYERQIARLKSWLLAAAVVAAGGWGVVAAILVMQ